MKTISHLFTKVDCISLGISIIEIYNEKVYDLLSPELRTLTMADDPLQDKVIMLDLTIKEVTEYDHF